MNISDIRPNLNISINSRTEETISIRLENKGLKNCLYRSPHGSLGDLNYDALSVKDTSGREVDYKGKIVYAPSNYVDLSTDEVYEFSVNIADNYKIEKDKDYLVSYKTICEPDDGVFISNEKIIRIEGANNSIENYDIVYSEPGLSSEDGQILTNPKITKKDGFQFLGFSESDINEISKIARDLHKTFKKLVDDRGFFDNLYYKHICAKDDIEKHPDGNKEVDAVHRNFKRAFNLIDKGNLLFYAANQELRCLANSKIGGYVRPGEGSQVKVIYLCELFEKIQSFPPVMGRGNKLGIIAHELFHLANPRILDHYYSYDNPHNSLPLDACLPRRKDTTCTDTYDIMQSQVEKQKDSVLPTTFKVTDWKIYQMDAGKKVNLNMYTADCLRFLVEDAFLLNKEKTDKTLKTDHNDPHEEL